MSGVARGLVDYSATITEQPDGSAEFSYSTSSCWWWRRWRCRMPPDRRSIRSRCS